MKKLLSLACLTFISSLAIAQTYTPIIMGGQSAAEAISGGVAGGYFGTSATQWNLLGGTTVVHPSFFSNSLGVGRSIIYGMSGTLSVGHGAFGGALSRGFATMWNGSEATLLEDPFDVHSSNATATDGTQIVGIAYEFDDRKGQVFAGDQHGIVWDATTGQVVADLFDGKPIQVSGVSDGKQVGHEFRGSYNEARLWNSVRRPFINLHNRSFDTSVATAIDGNRQVGMMGQEVRFFNETRRGARVLVTYAVIWEGSAESWNYLPYVSPSQPVSSSWATGVKGSYACGFGSGRFLNGATQYTHALAWNLNNFEVTDLHELLPLGYSTSRATGVDEFGNVSGYAVNPQNQVVAVIWKLN